MSDPTADLNDGSRVIVGAGVDSLLRTGKLSPMLAEVLKSVLSKGGRAQKSDGENLELHVVERA